MEDNKNVEQNVKDFKPDEALNLFFENFISQGRVVKEKEVVSGMKIKLKVLDTGELLAAESILSLNNPGIPYDITQKVRAASVLSQAILAINDIPVEDENEDAQNNKMRRSNLYTNLLSLPAIVINKIYSLYVEAADEQTKIYTDGKMVNKIENF